MARQSARDRVLACVEEYCAPVRDNPQTDDDRELTVAALVAVYGKPSSPQTWYTHGADDVLKATERVRAMRREAVAAAETGAPRRGRRVRRNRRVAEARADARRWEEMYREMLARYTIVERYFQRHRHAGDLDEIIRAGLDNPNRALGPL